MTLGELILEIERLSAQVDLTFADKCRETASVVRKLNRDELLQHLDEAGIIPERYAHDSSEEKLFAKYCDALLERALKELGMEATLLDERADSADVVASYGGYKLVADAKAFRLSRTAKNQKDFKVEALNQWRKGADYACLVCPLYQYPASNSQIYQQAHLYNVTLLSYTHLAFLIRKRARTQSLRPLWSVAKVAPDGKSAKAYWATVGQLVSALTTTSAKDWDHAVESASALLPRQANEQIAYWEAEKSRVMALPAQAARVELVVALKIDSKIAVIRQSVAEMEEITETFET